MPVGDGIWMEVVVVLEAQHIDTKYDILSPALVESLTAAQIATKKQILKNLAPAAKFNAALPPLHVNTSSGDVPLAYHIVSLSSIRMVEGNEDLSEGSTFARLLLPLKNHWWGQIRIHGLPIGLPLPQWLGFCNRLVCQKLTPNKDYW